MITDGLSAYLSRTDDIEVIARTTDGARALSLALATKPDVAVLDFHLPPLDGLAIAERLRSVSEARIVLLCTGHAEPEDFGAVRGKAHGLVRLRDPADRLLEAVRRAGAGDSYFPEAAQGEPDSSILLTRREREVLKLVALGHSNREISEKLHISIRTADNHKARIMRKLDAHTAVELTHHAILMGLVVPGALAATQGRKLSLFPKIE